jgi:hypothetical protein
MPYFLDPVVVRLTQCLSIYWARAGAAGSTVGLVNFSAYIVVASLWYLLMALFYLSIFRWLAQHP